MENKNANEFEITRVYDAPRELVWKVWTDPEMLKQWWGPDNVSIPECEVDLRVGGTFHIVMEAGEAMGPYKGTHWPMVAQFTVVEPTTKLAYSAKAWVDGNNDDTMIEQVTELTLSDEDGKTKVHLRAVINKAGPAAGMAVQGMHAGFTQQLEKLDKFLAGKK